MPNLILPLQDEENSVGWKRTRQDLALMEKRGPLLKRRAVDREISGLRVYDTRAENTANGE